MTVCCSVVLSGDVAEVVVLTVAAGEAAGPDACTTNIFESPAAFAEVAGVAVDADEVVCASEKDKVLSNAAAAQPNGFEQVAIIRMGWRYCGMA